VACSRMKFTFTFYSILLCNQK